MSGTRRRVLPPLIAFVGFLATWQAIVWIGDYPPFILPGPLLVAERFVTGWIEGTFWPHLVTTVQQIAVGFTAGAAAALPTGYLLARSRLANRVLSPYLVAAQAVPILALAPLIALWFGTGLVARSIIVALVVFFPVAISVMVAIRGIDRRLLEMARSYRVTRRQRIVLVEVPAALPGIIGGLRIGITLAVVGAIVAEWTGGELGLGVLINLARGSLFDIPLLFATLTVIALLGIALYGSVLLVERRVAART
ncbi:MAG TPA: ABC transporter permease [Patescibacteria group bacterium]|nr:ABC transporter permease [Patescibacteria group bacterium]